MRVLIVSDSHGRNTYLEWALKSAAPFDMFIHLGDLEGSQQFIEENITCPVEMVSGNNDFFSDLERDKCIMIGCYRVLLTHGHRYRVHHGTEEIKDWARANGADIVMFGHTHRPVIEMDDVIAVNPGSISQPRQENRRPSYMIMEIDKKKEVHFDIYYV